MPGPMRTTIERLDRPSAYYLGRNKKRKFNRDREDKDEREKTPEEQEDPLKDATTLYVGNLYDGRIDMSHWPSGAHKTQVFLYYRGADT
ncbi:MAG: hypothetical protein L6R40_008555 [Gallowayella cf. fulva]|nr:MAG: hypothetical protein L6R40_008555 [Xanthomendoza cf. fulva]